MKEVKSDVQTTNNMALESAKGNQGMGDLIKVNKMENDIMVTLIELSLWIVRNIPYACSIEEYDYGYDGATLKLIIEPQFPTGETGDFNLIIVPKSKEKK